MKTLIASLLMLGLLSTATIICAQDGGGDNTVLCLGNYCLTIPSDGGDGE